MTLATQKEVEIEQKVAVKTQTSIKFQSKFGRKKQSPDKVQYVWGLPETNFSDDEYNSLLQQALAEFELSQ